MNDEEKILLLEKLNNLIEGLHKSRQSHYDSNELKSFQKKMKKIYDITVILRHYENMSHKNGSNFIKTSQHDPLKTNSESKAPKEAPEVDYGAIIVETSEEGKNINEAHSNKNESRFFQKKGANNLETENLSWSINDRIFITNNLFSGYKERMDTFMQQVNSCDSSSKILELINNKASELLWDREGEAFIKLEKMCARNFD